MLKVEEANTAARALYERLGYEQVHLNDEGVLRLCPAERTIAGALAQFVAADGDEILKEVPSTILTMAKEIAPPEERADCETKKRE